MYFRFYTCITELIHVFKILHVYYGTYICVQNLFLSYRSYTCVTELILLFRILFFCEGTRRYYNIDIEVHSDLYSNVLSYVYLTT